MKSVDTYSQVLGALNGVSLGDAYGMPTEMFTREDIQKKLGEVDRLLPGQECSEISKGFLAGETTDDTAFSMILCKVIIENHGKVDPMNMVNKIKEWANNNQKSQNVLGPSTKRAFQEIEDGEKLEVAGKFGTTNGAAMRILPVGIVSDYRKPDIFMENVVAACLPTHNTNVAISGAMAIAAAVSCCIRGGSLNDMIAESQKAAKAGASQGYRVSEADIAAQIELAIELVSTDKNWKETLDDVYYKIGTGLPTEQAVPAALAMAYYAAGDPMLCAKYCANIGGDTDTIGAMACGICGAYSGIGAFDPSSLHTILTVNHLNWEPVAEQLVKYIS